MSKKPNIVMFIPDHYRGEAFGHMGNPCVRTPVMDGFVQSEAVSFGRAFCQNPVCTPSRCSFMTGWYPHVRGHRTMFHMLREGEPNLLSRLKRHGYYVWWGGKNDLVPAQNGYESYCNEKYSHAVPKPYRNGWRGDPSDRMYHSFFHGVIEDRKNNREHPLDPDWANVYGAINCIENRRPGDDPFCIYLPLLFPEPPFGVEEPFFSAVDRAVVPKRIPSPQDWSGKPRIMKGIHDLTGMKDCTEQEWNELRAVYYGQCGRLDHQFGMVLDALRNSDCYEDTAVLFFSDHGVYAGDYGLVDINQNTFEDSLVRVPLVVKPPAGSSVVPGRYDGLVELIDIVPTIEDIVGLPPTHSHFGKSLLPVIADHSIDHRQVVFCEGGRLPGERHCMELEYLPGHQDPGDLYYPRLYWQSQEGPEHMKAVMCRNRNHKYILRIAESDELYDLERDPQELCNVINRPDYREVAERMRSEILRWMIATCDVVPFDADQRK